MVSLEITDLPMNPQQEMHLEPLRLRESTVILINRLILIRILFIVVRLVLRIPVSFLGVDQQTVRSIYNWDTLIIIILAILEIGVVIYVAVQWLNEYYEIYPKEIIHKRGIFFRREEIYSCEHIQGFDLDQSVWGKIFDYGTITLYSPALEGKIYIFKISKPRRRLEEIRSVLQSSPKQPLNETIYLNRE